jgi:hypothetical protein
MLVHKGHLTEERLDDIWAEGDEYEAWARDPHRATVGRMGQ